MRLKETLAYIGLYLLWGSQGCNWLKIYQKLKPAIIYSCWTKEYIYDRLRSESKQIKLIITQII